MVRYWFGFENLEGTEYIGRLSNDAYTGASLEVDGSASMNRDFSDNILQPLWITSYAVSIRATLENQLSDIYNEVDRYWLFTLTENGAVIFQGYVSTDGMEQPFTAVEYNLDFEVLGHMHYLENIGYYDTDKNPYKGRASLLQIIARCLSKGYDVPEVALNIGTSHHLSVNGADIFENTYLQQSQFYDEEGEAIACDVLLKKLLKSIGCFIVQYGNRYLVCSLRVWQQFLFSPLELRLYTYDAAFLGTDTFVPSSAIQRIGSDISGGLSAYHVGESQTVSNTKMYNVVKVRHDYEYALDILPNGGLEADGATIPDWSLTSEATIVPDGLEIQGKRTVQESILAATSGTVALKEGDELELELTSFYYDNPTEQSFELLLTNTPSGTDYGYTLKITSVDPQRVFTRWEILPASPDFNGQIVTFPVDGDVLDTVQVSALPEDGDVTFKVYSPIYGNAYNASTSRGILQSVFLKAKGKDVEADEFVARRSDTTVGQVPEVYDIAFNTVDRNILLNIFTDVNGVAITAFNDDDIVSPMATFLAKDILMFFSETGINFRGDVYNLNFLGAKRIDDVGGPFIIVSQSTDLARNVSNVAFVRAVNDMPPHTLVVTRVVKEAAKPTIKT